MSEVVVINADGRRVSKVKSRRPTPYRVRATDPIAKTLGRLEKLEDAIFLHGPPFEYRTKFLNVYGKLGEARPDGDLSRYLDRLDTRRQNALLYCYEKLGWRARTTPFMKDGVYYSVFINE